jgi:hypothetical protein
MSFPSKSEGTVESRFKKADLIKVQKLKSANGRCKLSKVKDWFCT